MIPLFKKLEQRFAGKIKCECGVTDWREFLMVTIGDGSGSVRAACKQCGVVQKFEPETQITEVKND